MESEIWHVLGAGSIGCLWASSLAAKGFRVELILKDERMRQQSGQSGELELSAKDQITWFPVSFTSPSLISGPVTRLILCTKAHDALNALTEIAPHLHDNARILLLQNGMGSQQAIACAFPHCRVWAGSVTDGAYLKHPFSVCHAGTGQTHIGAFSQAAQPDDFIELLHGFRLNVTITDTIEEQLWKKLAINCCINGLTALFDCRNGALLDNGLRQKKLDELIQETEIVLPHYGISFNNLSTSVYQVCRDTADNFSSTCQDARQGRTTELACINHFLINKAADKGIQINKHRRLIKELQQLGIH